MKSKNVLVVILIILIVLFTMMFVCCKNKNEKVKNSITVIIRDNDKDEIFIVDLDKSFLTSQNKAIDVLKYLNNLDEDDENYLSYKVSGIGERLFVTEIGDLHPKDNQFIGIYTSLEDEADISEWTFDSIDYNGVMLYYSGVAISSMKIEAGVIYLFIIMEINN